MKKTALTVVIREHPMNSPDRKRSFKLYDLRKSIYEIQLFIMKKTKRMSNISVIERSIKDEGNNP